MARIGRSFPTHTITGQAGVSNVTKTLLVVCATSPRRFFTKSFKLAAVSASAPVLRALKLKSLKVLLVSSATSSVLSKATGKGRILKVTSATTNIIKRSTSKTLRASASSTSTFTRSMTKLLRKAQASTLIIYPGIFRPQSSLGSSVVQSRPFRLVLQLWMALTDN